MEEGEGGGGGGYLEVLFTQVDVFYKRVGLCENSRALNTRNLSMYLKYFN